MALLGLSNQEVRAFSVLRAVRAMYYPEVRQFQQDAAFEIDVSAEAARMDDRPVSGLLIPDDVLMAKQISQRALTAGSPTGGGHTIDDEMQSMIDIFVENTFAADNVSVLSGLQGNVYLPGQDARVELRRDNEDLDVAQYKTTLGGKSWTADASANTMSFMNLVAADEALIASLRASDQIQVQPNGGGAAIQTWTVVSVDADTHVITFENVTLTGLSNNDNYDLVIVFGSGWTGEVTAAREDEMSFRQVQFVPRHVRAFSRISKQLLVQSHGNIEMLLRKDLARAISKAVDRALLYGIGVGPDANNPANQPVGIAGTTGINKDTWTVAETEAARRVLIEKVLDAEERLATNEVPDQNGKQIERERMCKVLMSNRMKRRMRTVKFFGNYTDEPLLSDDDMLLGEYKAYYSTQVDHDDFFFCDWKDAVLAIWSGIEIMENPYSEDREGIIRITTDQMLDVNILRPGSMYHLDAA